MRRIEQVVGSWPGVSVHPHRFGGLEFRYGQRELGHIHRDQLADLPFPRQVRDRLVAEGRAQPHHVLPESGWVSRRIAAAADQDEVIDLFRLSYERAVAAARRRPERRT